MMTGRQIRKAREMLHWTQADLARRTFLPLAIVEVVEEHESTFMLLPDQMAAIALAFECAGVRFIPENGGGAGVRLRKADGP